MSIITEDSYLKFSSAIQAILFLNRRIDTKNNQEPVYTFWQDMNNGDEIVSVRYNATSVQLNLRADVCKQYGDDFFYEFTIRPYKKSYFIMFGGIELSRKNLGDENFIEQDE